MFKILIHNYNYHGEPQKKAVVSINTKNPRQFIKLLLKEYDGWQIEVWRNRDKELLLEGTLDSGCLECDFN